MRCGLPVHLVGADGEGDFDRCRALLAYHVESGEIDGVDVSGLSFALFLDTPRVMAEGNRRAGGLLG